MRIQVSLPVLAALSILVSGAAQAGDCRACLSDLKSVAASYLSTLGTKYTGPCQEALDNPNSREVTVAFNCKVGPFSAEASAMKAAHAKKKAICTRNSNECSQIFPDACSDKGLGSFLAAADAGKCN